MENRTRFNLVDSVGNWKKSLSGSYSMTSDNIQELESHLLDEIDHLKLEGLSEEEAFLIATKRIGTKDFLVSEFGKVSIFNTIIIKCMPLLQLILFYTAFRLSLSSLGSFEILVSEIFNLNLVTIIISFSWIFDLVLLVSLLMIVINLNNNLEKGKSALRLFNNIPLLVSGFMLLMLAGSPYYMLVTKGMSINEYLISIYQQEMFKPIFICSIFMMTATIYFKLRQSRKMKIA